MGDMPLADATIVDCFKPDENLTNALYDGMIALD
jgi:hypothetical protein